MKKYELLKDDFKTLMDGRKLYRIRALVDVRLGVHPGNLGGYIESERNLSHGGRAWVSDEAMVYGEARIDGDALVYDRARIFGQACINGYANIAGYARVYGNAKIGGYLQIDGHADISSINLRNTDE